MGWQQTLPIARKEEIGCGVPFAQLTRTLWLVRSGLLWDLDSDSIAGIANETSQYPMGHTNQQNDSVLSSGKIAAKNVDQSYRAANEAQISPPANPAVYPDVHDHNFYFHQASFPA